MASPDYSDGCMIALYPPADVAEALAVDGGLPPEEMHVTVAYLGDAADIDGDILREVVADLAERQPFTAQIAGHARFTGGDKDVMVALIDSPDLEDLRRDTLDALYERGIEIPRDHGFTAHCTITYLDPDEPSPLDRVDSAPIEFTALSAVHGTDRTDNPLEHPMAAPAREAFAAGWATSGGPLTDRVKSASVAAVQTAIEHADDPRILEVTIDLGKLEGMWALLFQRREDKQREHTRAVADVWRQLIDRDAVAAAVDAFRQRTGLTEGLSDFAAEALAAARAMLHALADLTGWTALRTAIREAIAAGRAEGMVNAVAIAAERASRIGLDWNIAFNDAYRALERLDELWGNADGWLGRTIDRAAGDLGRVLANGAEDGASRDEMIGAAMDVLTGTDIEAVAFTVDWAMTTAADEGALSLYRSEGVLKIDIITAGDGRVCPACNDAEAGSPWNILDAPRMPLHPLCVVGSTRVAAPGHVVPADEADRLTLDPSHGGASDAGNAGSAAASAVTEAGSDFGRLNIRAATVRDYVGDVVVIRTASGYELTATPNHPVATRRGWVPIAELKVGEHVLSSTRGEWLGSIDPDVDDVPPSIENIAKSFPVALGPVPTSAEDFHGDGAGSDVHVVLADRLLGDRPAPSVLEHARELQLRRGHVGGDVSFPADRCGDEVFIAASSSAPRFVSSADETGPFLGAGRGHSDVHCGAAIAGVDVSLYEARPDGGPTDGIDLRDRLLALTREVSPNDIGIVQGDSGSADGSTKRHIGLRQESNDLPSADTEGFCERVLALAPDVAADEIVNIDVQVFSGHVYNLETVGGWYVANGIVTHNCRCTYASSVSLAHFAAWFA